MFALAIKTFALSILFSLTVFIIISLLAFADWLVRKLGN